MSQVLLLLVPLFWMSSFENSEMVGMGDLGSTQHGVWVEGDTGASLSLYVCYVLGYYLNCLFFPPANVVSS